jgi:hypothetical protein
MSSDGIIEEDILEFRAAADVMDNQRAIFARGSSINNNAYMWEVPGNHPGNKVARHIILWVASNRKDDPLPGKECL